MPRHHPRCVPTAAATPARPPDRHAVRRAAAWGLATVMAVGLAACGPEDGAVTDTPATAAAPAPRPAPPRAPAPRGQLGTVTDIVTLYATEPTSGAGAVIGGVLGAAVGNQIGGGNGRKAATVLGAVGGAVAGNKIEKSRNTAVTGYRIDIRLDGGGQTSITVASPSGLAEGQRVRVVDGDVVPA